MKFTHSMMIVRTRNGNTVGCHCFSTYNYQKIEPNQFVYNGYMGESFELYENVGGQVKVKVYDRLNFSGIDFENEVTISNVTAIEIISEHNI